jgi:hypothetical protein
LVLLLLLVCVVLGVEVGSVYGCWWVFVYVGVGDGGASG